MKFTEGLKSTGNTVCETPQEFFDRLNNIFRFNLDVCALPENAKCKTFYSPEDDGLSRNWMGGYGATRHTEKRSLHGSRRHQKRYRKTIAALLSCSFLHAPTLSGSTAMSRIKLSCISLKAV